MLNTLIYELRVDIVVVKIIIHGDDFPVNEIFVVCFLFLTIFNEGAYLTFKSIFNKVLNLF